jgi:enterochelin esterase-like enzyme
VGRRLAAVTAAVSLSLAAAGSASPSGPTLPGFHVSTYGGAGGTVLEGYIPGLYAPARATSRTPSYVYLPPHFTTARRYPVVYLLHGMPGTPRIYMGAPSHLPQVAAQVLAAGGRPFIAVAPYAGPATERGRAEWAGQWEDYLVHDVVPWTDAHLPTISSPAGRVVAGLSAGGYGAIDIGLRHLDLFGTLESWSGYFHPLADGPFVHASASYLAAHDPTHLVRREAVQLRRDHTRFELSTGVGHGEISPAMTTAFAAELHSLHLTSDLWRVPASHAGPGYPAQMTHGLAYAFGRA